MPACYYKPTSIASGGAVGGDAYALAIAHQRTAATSSTPCVAALGRSTRRADRGVRRALQAVPLRQRDRRQLRAEWVTAAWRARA